MISFQGEMFEEWSPVVLEKLAQQLNILKVPTYIGSLGLVVKAAPDLDIQLLCNGTWEVSWPGSGWQTWIKEFPLDPVYEQMAAAKRPVERSLNSICIDLKYRSHHGPDETLVLKIAQHGKWYII